MLPESAMQTIKRHQGLHRAPFLKVAFSFFLLIIIYTVIYDGESEQTSPVTFLADTVGLRQRSSVTVNVSLPSQSNRATVKEGATNLTEKFSSEGKDSLAAGSPPPLRPLPDPPSPQEMSSAVHNHTVFAGKWAEATTISPTDLSFPDSTYSCTFLDRWEHRLCYFNNLAVYNGSLYYIVPQNTTDITFPSIRLTPFTTNKSASLPYGKRPAAYQLEDLVRASSEKGLKDLIGRTTHEVQIVQFDAAASLTSISKYSNWWHVMVDDASEVYYRLCKYLRVCSSSQFKTAAILHYDGPSLEGLHPAVKSLLNCFGTQINIKAENSEHNSHIKPPPKEIVIIKRMVFGVGESLLNPLRLKKEYQRVDPAYSLARIRHLRSCAKLPTVPSNAVGRKHPRVVLVNRPYESAHSIMGLDEVFYKLTRLHPELDVEISFLNEDSFQKQAKLYAEADIVLESHGAASGNFYFLGPTSVVIVVTDTEHTHLQEAEVLQRLPRPFYNTTALVVNLKDKKPVLIMHKLLQDKSYQALDATTRHGIIFSGNASIQKTFMEDVRLQKRHFTTYYVKPDRVVSKIEDAVKLWYSKQSGIQQLIKASEEAEAGFIAGAEGHQSMLTPSYHVPI